MVMLMHIFSVCLNCMFERLHAQSCAVSLDHESVYVSILRMTVSICLVCKSLSPSSDKDKQLHPPLSFELQ